jgi:hypothetical protein
MALKWTTRAEGKDAMLISQIGLTLDFKNLIKKAGPIFALKDWSYWLKFSYVYFQLQLYFQ